MINSKKNDEQNLLEKPNIPNWHTYFMNIANVVKTRANCHLRQVGVVLVQGKRIIATGYNGTPAGVTNCLDGGCKRCLLKKRGVLKSGEKKGSCLCVHAEVNAVIQSACYGTATKGSSLYSTLLPCMLCSKELINAGIEEIYYVEGDPGEHESLSLLKKYMKRVKKISLQ